MLVACGPSESIQFHFDEITPVQCNLNGQAKWTDIKSVSTYLIYRVIDFWGLGGVFLREGNINNYQYGIFFFNIKSYAPERF